MESSPDLRSKVNASHPGGGMRGGIGCGRGGEGAGGGGQYRALSNAHLEYPLVASASLTLSSSSTRDKDTNEDSGNRGYATRTRVLGTASRAAIIFRVIRARAQRSFEAQF